MDPHGLRFHLAAPLLSHAGRGARRGRLGVARRDLRLELEHRAGARWKTLAPQRPARVYLQAPAALAELRIDLIDAEDAAASVEVGEIAGTQPLPAAPGHAR